MRTQDPERGEVTAYQDGVWLGRAIVPVDAIAPGEAPPEWNELVRFVGSCVVRVAAGTRRWVAEVGPAGASQPWSYVPLILYGWCDRPSDRLRQCSLPNECSLAHDDQLQERQGEA